jgi:Ankyrin repeats (3 copies)
VESISFLKILEEKKQKAKKSRWSEHSRIRDMFSFSKLFGGTSKLVEELHAAIDRGNREVAASVLSRLDDSESSAHVLNSLQKCKPFGQAQLMATPLIRAVLSGRRDIVFMLVAKAQIDLNLGDPEQHRTALHFACLHDDESVVQVLLAPDYVDRIDLNLLNNSGSTPLHWAVLCGAKLSVKMLLSAADIEVNARDRDSKTPLALAGDLNSVDLVLAMACRVDVLGHYERLRDCGAADAAATAAAKVDVLRRLADSYCRRAPLMLLCFRVVERERLDAKRRVLPELVVELCFRRSHELAASLPLAIADLNVLTQPDLHPTLQQH